MEECGGEEGGGGEGERVRRLVFLDTPHLVQTEIRLQPNTSMYTLSHKHFHIRNDSIVYNLQ